MLGAVAAILWPLKSSLRTKTNSLCRKKRKFGKELKHWWYQATKLNNSGTTLSLNFSLNEIIFLTICVSLVEFSITCSQNHRYLCHKSDLSSLKLPQVYCLRHHNFSFGHFYDSPYPASFEMFSSNFFSFLSINEITISGKRENSASQCPEIALLRSEGLKKVKILVMANSVMFTECSTQ